MGLIGTIESGLTVGRAPEAKAVLCRATSLRCALQDTLCENMLIHVLTARLLIDLRNAHGRIRSVDVWLIIPAKHRVAVEVVRRGPLEEGQAADKGVPVGVLINRT